MARKDYVPVACTVTATTDGAVCLGTPDGEEVWVPRSLCEDGDAIEVDDEEVRIVHWKADDLGLV